jgi:branched-chain amino acid transport system permease protein
MTELLQVLVQGMLIGSTYGLLALGMGLIFGVMGIVSFAQGDLVSLGMFLCLALYAGFGFDPYVSVFVTVPLLMIAGGAIYWFLIRPIAGQHLLMVVQLTLGLSFVIQNGLLMTFGGQAQRVPSMVDSDLLIVRDVVIQMPHVIAAAVSFGLALGLYAMLGWTDAGRAIRAVSQNSHAAYLMGIKVARVRLVTFGIGCGLVAIAASLLAPGAVMFPAQGFRYTVIILLTMVLGGMTNFVSIMCGGIVIAMSEAVGAVYFADTFGLLLPYLVFVLVMIIRPQGLTWRTT